MLNYCTVFHNTSFLASIGVNAAYVEAFPDSLRLVDAASDSLILEVWQSAGRRYLVFYPFAIDGEGDLCALAILTLAKACAYPLRLVKRNEQVEIGLVLPAEASSEEELRDWVCELRAHANGPMRHALLELAMAKAQVEEIVDFLDEEEETSS